MHFPPTTATAEPPRSRSQRMTAPRVPLPPQTALRRRGRGGAPESPVESPAADPPPGFPPRPLRQRTHRHAPRRRHHRRAAALAARGARARLPLHRRALAAAQWRGLTALAKFKKPRSPDRQAEAVVGRLVNLGALRRNPARPASVRTVANYRDCLFQIAQADRRRRAGSPRPHPGVGDRIPPEPHRRSRPESPRHAPSGVAGHASSTSPGGCRRASG